MKTKEIFLIFRATNYKNKMLLGIMSRWQDTTTWNVKKVTAKSQHMSVCPYSTKNYAVL